MKKEFDSNMAAKRQWPKFWQATHVTGSSTGWRWTMAPSCLLLSQILEKNSFTLACVSFRSGYDWQTVCLGVEPHLGLMTRYVLNVTVLYSTCDEWSGLSFVIVSHLVSCQYVELKMMYIQYVQGLQAQYSRLCPISSSFCYHGSLDTWTVVCLTAAKFKPLVFSV
jgi:hypothetical protein